MEERYFYCQLGGAWVNFFNVCITTEKGGKQRSDQDKGSNKKRNKVKIGTQAVENETGICVNFD